MNIRRIELVLRLAAGVFVAFASVVVEGNFDHIRIGFTNIDSEYVAADVLVDFGAIPTWLNGTFIRQACGAFGETGTQSNIINKVEHIFDCLEVGQSFRIGDGDAKFYSRFYDTTKTDIWKYYKENMNESSVYWYTTYSEYNETAFHFWETNTSNSAKLPSFPQVGWWQVGKNVLGKSERHGDGVLIDVHNVEAHGTYQFRDVNMGYPPNTLFTSEPAHEQTDWNGIVWHTTQVCTFSSLSTLQCRHTVYKIEDDTRIVVGESPHVTLDLSLCAGGGRYPDIDSRLEYFHSFAMTENYIILPTTSYLLDICGYFNIPGKPYFYQAFEWVPERNSSLYVMRKSDGVFVAIIPTPPMFPLHQLNSFEKDGKIHVDFTYYPNSSAYEVDFTVEHFLAGLPFTTFVDRFTIDEATWTLESQKPLRRVNPSTVDFPGINYHQYNGRPYSYAYLQQNQYGTTAIIKLNVDTGDELWYNLTAGLFAQEPIFVPRPNSQSEDDGIILTQGWDGTLKKAFLVILDAVTMTPIAHITAPGLALAGLHNKFFAPDIGMGPALSTIDPTPIENGASEIFIGLKSLTVAILLNVVLLAFRF